MRGDFFFICIVKAYNQIIYGTGTFHLLRTLKMLYFVVNFLSRLLQKTCKLSIFRKLGDIDTPGCSKVVGSMRMILPIAEADFPADFRDVFALANECICLP